MEMRLLDLFSGIGGFSYAAEKLVGGYKTVAFCEMDEFCQKVLQKHWPKIPIYDDVRTLDATRLGRIDIVTGGYPCQPFSQAGKRQGEKDERHLWPEMLRIIKSCKPRYVVAENVAGHVTMGLDQVLTDLEDQGYTTRPIIIPACAKNAPHRRDRVWIIGELTTNTNNSGNRASRGNINKEQQTIEQGWKEQPLFEPSRHNENVANTSSLRGQNISGNNKKFATRSAKNENVEFSNSCSSDRGSELMADTKNVRWEQTEWQGWESSRRGSQDIIGSETERKETDRSDATYTESEGLAHSNEREICKTKQPGMDSDEKGNWSGLRSKSSRRNQLSGENVADTSSKGSQRGIFRGEIQRWQTKQQYVGHASTICEQPKQRTKTVEQRVGDLVNGISKGLLEHFDREPEDIPRVTSGEKDRAKKLKALGNSIVPQVAAEIFIAIKYQEEN